MTGKDAELLDPMLPESNGPWQAVFTITLINTGSVPALRKRALDSEMDADASQVALRARINRQPALFFPGSSPLIKGI